MESAIAVYQPPKEDSLTARINISMFPTFVNEELTADIRDISLLKDFQGIKTHHTKKGVWDIYSRPEYGVSNFPEGETSIHSMLALYERKGETQHAILRSSTSPIDEQQFMQDLDAFTRHYTERPFIFGFPSKLTTFYNQIQAFAYMAVGAGIGLGTVSLTNPSGLYTPLGVLIGMVAVPAVFMTANVLSEKRAKNKISAPGQYFTGDTAKRVLSLEKEHSNVTAIQRELYRALQEENQELTPERFLTHGYERMHDDLIQEGKENIDQEGHVKPELLEDMVNVVRTMLKIPRRPPQFA